MFIIKKLLLTIFVTGICGGIINAQGPTVAVTFNSDKTVTEPIEITLGRQTLTLPAFTAPGGSSISFRSGLTTNTAYPLKAFARKSNLSSQNYNFTISNTSPVVTVTVAINPKLQANQQITFAASSGQLLPAH
jgi:hypothetical protein